MSIDAAQYVVPKSGGEVAVVVANGDEEISIASLADIRPDASAEGDTSFCIKCVRMVEVNSISGIKSCPCHSTYNFTSQAVALTSTAVPRKDVFFLPVTRWVVFQDWSGIPQQLLRLDPYAQCESKSTKLVHVLEASRVAVSNADKTMVHEFFLGRYPEFGTKSVMAYKSFDQTSCSDPLAATAISLFPQLLQERPVK